MIDKIFLDIKKMATCYNFIIVIFQGNLVLLAFKIGAQMRLFYSYNINNKVNLSLTLLYGLLILMFGFTFFLIF